MARVRACCDVNLMTSCCSDGRSKQLNKGVVVLFFFCFLLHLCGEEGPITHPAASLWLENREASVGTVEYGLDF